MRAIMSAFCARFKIPNFWRSFNVRWISVDFGKTHVLLPSKCPSFNCALDSKIIVCVYVCVLGFVCVCAEFNRFIQALVPPYTCISTRGGQRARFIHVWSWDGKWFHTTMDGKDVIGILFVKCIHHRCTSRVCVCVKREGMCVCVWGSSSCFIIIDDWGLCVYVCMYVCVCVCVCAFVILCAHARACACACACE